MEITGIGFILIFIGLLLLFFPTKWLYYLTIFFIPFSATSIINITYGALGSGIQASIYFGSLLLGKELLRTVFQLKLILPEERGWSFFLLGAFGFIAFFSLIMPIIIDGKVTILSPEATIWDHWEIPITLTRRHFTQLLYLIYGISLSVLIFIRNTNYQNIDATIKVYLISSIFVCFWGLFQWICFVKNIPYPAFLFNNNIHPGGMGYDEVLEGLFSIKRISSVSIEPSILGQFLLSILPIILFAVTANHIILSHFWDKLSLLLIVIVLLLSTSSSGYLGLLFMILSVIIINKKVYKLRLRLIILTIGFSIICILIYIWSPVVQNLIEVSIFSKLSTASGLERLQSIQDSWTYFLRYPILGVGWGTANSYDLVVKLLSNIGIIGFLIFMIFLIYIIRRFIIIINDKLLKSTTYNSLFNGILIALVTVLFMNTISGFSFMFGQLWFLIGLLIGSTCLMINEVKRGTRIISLEYSN
jgi:hypothetical protein